MLAGGGLRCEVRSLGLGEGCRGGEGFPRGGPIGPAIIVHIVRGNSCEQNYSIGFTLSVLVIEADGSSGRDFPTTFHSGASNLAFNEISVKRSRFSN